MEINETKVTEEQIAYAKLLNIGAMASLVFLIVFFVIYLAGIVKPDIALAELPKYWGLSLPDYLEQTNYKAGWSWLNMIGKGKFLNFIGISLLAGVTVFCYLGIIPILIKKKDTVYVIIAVLEVLVIVLAASGILMTGH